MRIFLIALLCLLFCFPAFADQQTTVLFEQVTIDKAEGRLPFIDGSTDTDMERQANSLMHSIIKDMVKDAGGYGSISYEVVLNRPSLIGVLLKVSNNSNNIVKGLNVDLTTGKEFTVTDFFINNDTVKAALGDYSDVLFTEKGICTRSGGRGNYTNVVTYSSLLTSMRIGEAGRLLQIARLTENAEGKTLFIKKGNLMAIKLDTNTSTGFRWEMKLEKADEKKIVKVGSSFIMPKSSDQRVGVPGSEVLMLAAEESGTCKVTMEYKRPWERLPLKSFSFTVIITE
ncbi:MAG: protease inhibitor I42 family protein [Phascolarctobacterium sp.]|nr:protease inhibitor I42 family protein [Phascolarctobacterium sp.]